MTPSGYTGTTLVRLRDNDGVTFNRWPDSEIAKLKPVWEQVIAKEIGASKRFKQVWEHFSAYREAYREWGDNAFLR